MYDKKKEYPPFSLFYETLILRNPKFFLVVLQGKISTTILSTYKYF